MRALRLGGELDHLGDFPDQLDLEAVVTRTVQAGVSTATQSGAAAALAGVFAEVTLAGSAAAGALTRLAAAGFASGAGAAVAAATGGRVEVRRLAPVSLVGSHPGWIAMKFKGVPGLYRPTPFP